MHIKHAGAAIKGRAVRPLVEWLGQDCKEKHLHRYLAEFDFRYKNRSALGVEDKARSPRHWVPKASGLPTVNLTAPKEPMKHNKRRHRWRLK